MDPPEEYVYYGGFLNEDHKIHIELKKSNSTKQHAIRFQSVFVLMCLAADVVQSLSSNL